MLKKLSVIMILLMLTLPVSAQKTNWPEATDEIKLRSAQMCYVESGFAENDCIAELHIIRKRSAKMGFLPMLFKYSALDARNSRAREAMTYPWGDVENKSLVWNKNWAKLRFLVEDILAGNRRDVCFGAVHWGSKTDPQQDKQVKMNCQKKTHNIYYKLSK